MRLNAFTDEERDKLAGLSNGGGTTERLSTRRSLDLVLSGAEQVIEFDPAQTSPSVGLSITPSGTILCGIDGYFDGILSLHVDKSGGAGADMSIWVEKKPLATGVWELASDGMTNPIVYDDGGQAVAFSGQFSGVSGDEFRIMIQLDSGTATLTTSTKVKTLGTVNDWAASLSLFRIGPPNP